MGDDGVQRTAAVDDYEAAYMGTEGEVVHRDKRVSRLMAGLLAVPGLFSILIGVIIAVSNPDDLVPGILSGALGLLLMLLAVLFSSLRTAVSTREVHIQYGLWGPRVPIEAITECEVIEYDAMKFGGWGIKLSSDGTWAYSMPGADKALRIHWTTPKGKTKKAVVTAEDASALHGAVRRAQAEATRRRKRLAPGDIEDAELAAPDSADAKLEAELEAEAEALLEREREA